MRKFTSAAATIGFALLSTAAPASALDRQEARTAVGLAAQNIEQDYVDAEKARHIAAALRKAQASLTKRNLDGGQLADRITELLRSVSADPHFRFGYSPESMPADMFAPKSSGDASAAAKKTARINNFGVLQAQRLPGNIGFLDLDQFTDPDQMRHPLAAAMELLKHCDAMIIDLRYNGGGFARGAALAASYFLPQSPQRLLVTLQTRDARQSLDIRTEVQLESDRFLDRPVYILTGARTFSAAEMFASSLQQGGRASVVGTRTRGGGNPVARIRLTPHYALLLPTTRGVSPGGKSWEGVGVVPDVPVDEKDALTAARRVALGALVAARPRDMLAANWRGLLDEMTPAISPANRPAHGGRQ